MAKISDEQIIAALMAKGSIKAAAAFLKCSTRTIYKHMQSAKFKAMYTQAKADLLKGATAKLQNRLSAAVDTLSGIMADKTAAPQTRANCAVSILQYGHRYTETTDILERLDELEQTQRGLNNVQ